MPFRRSLTLASLAMGLAAVLVGCTGRSEPTPLPTTVPTAAVEILPTSTPLPTETPLPSATPTPKPTTGVPSDQGDAVVQFARISHSRWEPELLAHMYPHFSLQASGFMVYQYDGGDSEDGWYQTVLTPTMAADFVRLLVDQVGVMRLAKKRAAQVVHFDTAADGTAVNDKVIGVIYVKTATDEGQLVITEDELNFPPQGPDFKTISDLKGILQAVELWKSAPDSDFTPEQQKDITGILGWWLDQRLPYSPDQGTLFGTRASPKVPVEVAGTEWPLTLNLATSFDEDYLGAPKSVAVSGDEMAAMWRAYQGQEGSFWGPLWFAASPEGATPTTTSGTPLPPARFLVGLRPRLPGGNHVEVDYTFSGPRGLATDR